MNIACAYSVESYATVEKPLRTQKEIPFGLAMIATVLKKAGHNVRILVLTADSPLKKMLATFVEQHQPRLFCLSAVTTQMPFITRVAETVKQIEPSIYVLVGGHHVSFNPEESIRLPAIDAICIGEGEHAVVKIAAQLEQGETPGNIPNLWIKNREAIQRNAPLPFNSNLDDLPYIDRSLWLSWIQQPHRTPAMLLGRGCPFRCAYCCNHISAKLAEGKYVRFRSSANVCQEIRELKARLPDIQDVYLEMETFGANLNYSFEMCEALERLNREFSEPIAFGVNLAVTRKISTDECLLQALKRAGITYLNIGLESGSKRVRDEILRRPRYSNWDIIRFCRLARQHGLSINMYVLLGVPGETLNDFKETVQVVRECRPRDVFLSIFYPYQGTKLYNESLQYMIGNNVRMDRERVVACLDLPDFSRFQMTREYILFYYNVYRGLWPFIAVARRVLYAAVATYPVLRPLMALLPLGARAKKRVRFLRGLFQNSRTIVN